MAKRTSSSTTAGKRNVGNRGSRGTQSKLERNYKNYRDSVLEWSELPAVRYVAGGMGLALLARLAYSMSDRYPEVSRFLKENLETIEDKLKEFRGIENSEDVTGARH